MKAAAYARVSSDSQDVDLSISAQLRALRDYAAKHDCEIVREFIDEAESGRTAKRPAFREMISMAKLRQPPFQTILVWKLNRFSRSRADSITYKTLLRNKGIDVISINEPMDDSPTGRLLEGVIESIDEFYSENLGQDIKRGMRENASRGFFNGSRPPYGYHTINVDDGNKVRRKLEPDGEVSPSMQTVKRIFELAYKDVGCKEIAMMLNNDSLRTSTGQRWGKGTVYQVLTNEAYCGTLVWGSRKGCLSNRSGDAPVRLENAWAAIIDKMTFQIIQKKLAAKSPKVVHPRRVSSTFILSGLLFCSCGRAMTGCSAKSGTHFYYICARSLKQGKAACNARMLPKEKLERLIVRQLQSRVLTRENLELLVKMVNEELLTAASGLKNHLDIIDTELRDVKARLGKLYEALETGKLDMDDLAPRIKELKTRQDELNKNRVLVEAETAAHGTHPVNEAMVKSYAEDLRTVLEEADITERKAFLRSFVKRVEVDKEQVTVHYTLPMPLDGKSFEEAEVLSIGNYGGPGRYRTCDQVIIWCPQVIGIRTN